MERIPAEVFPPGEFLKDELDGRGWTQTEFAEIIGRPQRVVNEIVLAKRQVTPDTAREIAAALGTSAQLWMNLETAYQLSKVSPKTERISREAALRERFPVREMLKRGWIRATKDFEELENSVLNYFNLGAVSDPIHFPHAARRKYEENLTSIQWAWLFRVSQLAETLQVTPYSKKLLQAAIPDLEQLMTEPEEVRHIPRILADCGVRFVIVEPIPGSKIDGVCFWIKNGKSPVISLSLKGDFIDRFWFNFWHEIEHVLRGDGREQPIIDEFNDDGTSDIGEAETAANAAAEERCVPKAAMDNFFVRHNPMFSEKSLVGFARLMDRHPGIVAGQIQKRTERWDLFRKKHQPRVRSFIIQSALTDGYKRTGPINL